VKPSLTVVLPVRNAEASLSGQVTEVLETAGELTDAFQVVLVDDGSTDDTFDVAVELSHRYPQVEVLRNAQPRGLGATLRSVRAKVTSDVVIVHDGVTPFDASQIRRLWHEQRRRAGAAQLPAGSSGSPTMDDLKLVATTHAAMEAAHSQLLGFRLLHSDPTSHSTSGSKTGGALLRRESPETQGVGAIPPLPRPNFIGALANFALGE